MGNKYNFEFNPKRLSSEDIEKHQDFDALLEKFSQEKPTGQNRSARIRRIAYVGGAIAAGIAVLWFMLVVNPTERRTPPSQIAEAYFASQPFVNPPIADVQPAFVNFEINAQTGGEILYASGSKLVIPRQAFRNDRGENIRGEVDIRFRELIDYVDFFLAGVPMTYDSSGVRYHFESAGMLEIYAEQDGRPVHLAPGKRIEVVLFSEILVDDLNVKPAFNVYKLDTAARQWLYYGPDQIEFLDEISYDKDDPLAEAKENLLTRLKSINQKEDAALAELEATIPVPVKPLRPFPNDPNVTTFEFPTDIPNSQVAALYEGTVWQLSPNNAPFDENMLVEYQWNLESIEKINNQEYEIVLTKPDFTLRILAAPTLIGEDYQKALQRYEADQKAYEIALAERENKLTLQRDAINAWAAEEREAAIATYDKTMEETSFVNTSPSSVFRRKVINRFTVNSLGLWNCDRPVRPDKKEVMFPLKDQKGNVYQNMTAFVVDKTHNTIYRYYAGEDQPLPLEESSENLLWVVTEDQKLALLRAVKPDEETSEMILTLIDEVLASEADVRRVLVF